MKNNGGVALVTALPMELAPVTDSWGNTRPEPGVLYYPPDGTAGEQHEPTVALCTGPGTIAAALHVTELIKTAHPRLIIAGGIAGGVPEDVAPGDIVIARRTGFYDVDLTALGLPAGVLIRGGMADTEAPLRPKREDLERTLRELGEDGALHEGLILTGDTFLNPQLLQELPEAWRVRIASSCAVDMESAAWTQAADRAGVPWIVIRLISDSVASGSRLPFPAVCLRAGAILHAVTRFFLSQTPVGW